MCILLAPGLNRAPCCVCVCVVCADGDVYGNAEVRGVVRVLRRIRQRPELHYRPTHPGTCIVLYVRLRVAGKRCRGRHDDLLLLLLPVLFIPTGIR